MLAARCVQHNRQHTLLYIIRRIRSQGVVQFGDAGDQVDSVMRDAHWTGVKACANGRDEKLIRG